MVFILHSIPVSISILKNGGIHLSYSLPPLPFLLSVLPPYLSIGRARGDRRQGRGARVASDGGGWGGGGRRAAEVNPPWPPVRWHTPSPRPRLLLRLRQRVKRTTMAGWMSSELRGGELERPRRLLLGLYRRSFSTAARLLLGL